MCIWSLHKLLYGSDAATNDAHVNDVFGKGDSQGASADHKAPSGARSGGSEARGSEARDTGRATSARSTGSNGRHIHSSVAGKAHCG